LDAILTKKAIELAKIALYRQSEGS